MSQSETLQNIYSKIADIYDKFCNLSTNPIPSTDSDIETWITTDISLSETGFTATPLILSNPSNSSTISNAQNQLNVLITSTLLVAKEERLPTDNVYLANTGDLVPIPKGSPISLLPILLKSLLLYKAPLKVLLSIILDIIENTLREHLKRKLLGKNATRNNNISFNSSKLLKIPSNATHLVIESSNFPAYISKRFDQDIDKSIIKTNSQSNPDLCNYYPKGLSSISFGMGLQGEILFKNIFWDNDRRVEYVNQIFEIPKYEYTNIDKYAYVYLKELMIVTVSYLS